MTDSQFICLALEFPPRPSKHTSAEATDGLNKCRSGCEPAHLSFAAQRSADSDFQRTAHLQCVNKRPIHSATGARLVLYQTPAKPDIRPATAKVGGGGDGVYTLGTHLGFIPRSLQPSAHYIGPGYHKHEYAIHLASCARLEPRRI